jgi:hypothetical protein
MSMHVNADKKILRLISSSITKKLNNWIEIIVKTANEKCNAPDCNRKNLNCHLTAFIMESNDAAILVGLSNNILTPIQSKLKPIFRKVLGDAKVEKRI